MADLTSGADETRFLRSVLKHVWVHWSAVVLRGICRKGPRGYQGKNISLEGLLEEFSGNVDVFLKVAHPPALKRWLGTCVTPAAAREKINHDKMLIIGASKKTKTFGDVVAHLHLRPRRISGRRLRSCREQARKIVDRYFRLIVRRAPDYSQREEFVERFRGDVDRLLRFSDEVS